MIFWGNDSMDSVVMIFRALLPWQLKRGFRLLPRRSGHYSSDQYPSDDFFLASQNIGCFCSSLIDLYHLLRACKPVTEKYLTFSLLRL